FALFADPNDHGQKASLENGFIRKRFVYERHSNGNWSGCVPRVGMRRGRGWFADAALFNDGSGGREVVGPVSQGSFQQCRFYSEHVRERGFEYDCEQQCGDRAAQNFVLTWHWHRQTGTAFLGLCGGGGGLFDLAGSGYSAANSGTPIESR